jgi:effector-binding domain-containing protein
MFVEGEAEGNDQVMVTQSYEGKVVVFDYYGAYDETPNGWIQIDQYIAENELEKNGLAWDEYITDPTIETDTAKWLTRLYQPVK